jgi:two-component system response regulator MtrA
LTKPFWPAELIARVRTRLRRPVLARDRKLAAGALSIDLDERTATVAGVACGLTRVEHDLLVTLAQRPGAAVTRRELVRRALDPDGPGDERTLDVHMSRIRRKLGAEGGRVETVRGIGYRFRA